MIDQDPQLSAYFLGSPRLEIGGEAVDLARRKSMALFVYLTVTGESHRREHLAGIFWPDNDSSSASAYLRHALWDLNSTLGEQFLDVTRETAGVSSSTPIWIDVFEFRRKVETCVPSDDSPACMETLQSAVELYRGDFLEGFSLPDSAPFDEWQFFHTDELRRLLGNTLERLGHGLAHIGKVEEALTAARRWLNLDPLHEPAHRMVMTLFAQLDQRAAALRQYEILSETLDREIGQPPEPESLDLYNRIRTGHYPGKKQTDGAGEHTHSPPDRVTGGLQIRPAIEDRRSISSLTTPRSNLPAQTTPFIGRQSELEELRTLLETEHVRILSLVGPGGIGKTRLALQAAADAATVYPQGVWFVPLAPLSEGVQIAPAIVQALGLSFLKEEGGASFNQLFDYLRHKRLLLVLDNFEHLLDDESAQFLTELVSEAPKISLLVTSRVRLNLQGEYLYPVSGLLVPPAEMARSAFKSWREYSALQLFEQSAQQVKPDFTFQPESLAQAIQITHQVFGIPLAVKLAASWVDMLPLAEISGEIDRSLDFLESDLRDLPERQRSLRAVFDTSWNLLTPEERAAFQELAVFQGGFTRQAAAEVAGASLRTLSGLANKSLLHRTDENRYELHELLRQFAEEGLQKDPERWQAVRERHAETYTQLTSEMVQQLTGSQQKKAFETFGMELENARAAWNWALEHRQAERLELMLDGLAYYLFQLGRDTEIERLFDPAIAAFEAEPRDRKLTILLAKLLTARSLSFSEHVARAPVERYRRALIWVQELNAEKEMGYWYAELALGIGWRVDLDRGIRMLNQHLDKIQSDGNPFLLGRTLLVYSELLYLQDSRPPAYDAASRALDLFRRQGNQLEQIYALHVLALLASKDGDYAQASQIYEQCLELHQALDNRSGISYTLENIGRNLQAAGEDERAIAYFEEGAAIFKELGNLTTANAMVSWIGLSHLRLGNLEEARRLRWQMIQTAQEVNHPTGASWGYWELGEVERVAGNPEAAREYYQKSLEYFEDNRTFNLYCFYQRGLGDLALTAGDLETAEDHFRQSLDLAMEAYHQWATAYALTGLGRVALQRQNWETSREHLTQALVYAHAQHDRGLILKVLDAFAERLTLRGEFAQALEIYSFIVNHPASWHEYRETAGQHIAELARQVPAAEFSAAQARAQKATLNEIAGLFLPSEPDNDQKAAPTPLEETVE